MQWKRDHFPRGGVGSRTTTSLSFRPYPLPAQSSSTSRCSHPTGLMGTLFYKVVMAKFVHSGGWGLKQSWGLNEAAQKDLTDKGGKKISALLCRVLGTFSSLAKSVSSPSCLVLKCIYPWRGLHIKLLAFHWSFIRPGPPGNGTLGRAGCGAQDKGLKPQGAVL